MFLILFACIASTEHRVTDTSTAIVVDPGEDSQDSHPLYGSWSLAEDQPYGQQTLIRPVMTYGPAGFMLSADEGQNQDGSTAFRSFATCGQADFIPDPDDNRSGQIITSPLNIEGAYTLRYKDLTAHSVVLLNDTDGDGIYETEQSALRSPAQLMLQFEHSVPSNSEHLIIELDEVAGAIPSQSGQLEYRACRAEDLDFSEQDGRTTIRNGVDFLGQRPLLRLPEPRQVSSITDLALNEFQSDHLTVEALGQNQITISGSINKLKLIALAGGQFVTLENPAAEVEVSANNGSDLEVSVSEKLSGGIENASLRYLGDPVIDVEVGDNATLGQIQ